MVEKAGVKRKRRGWEESDVVVLPAFVLSLLL